MLAVTPSWPAGHSDPVSGGLGPRIVSSQLELGLWCAVQPMRLGQRLIKAADGAAVPAPEGPEPLCADGQSGAHWRAAMAELSAYL